MTVEEIVNDFMKILGNAYYKAQQKFLKTFEATLREEGFGKVFESWGDDFPWMKNFNPLKE